MPKRPEQQEDGRYRDFDEFWRSTEQIPIRFTVRGQSFELPPDIPAKAAMTVAAIVGKYGEAESDLSESDMLAILESIMGRDQWARLLDTGIGLGELEDVVRWAAAQYGIADQGNPTTPVEAGDQG